MPPKPSRALEAAAAAASAAAAAAAAAAEAEAAAKQKASAVPAEWRLEPQREELLRRLFEAYSDVASTGLSAVGLYRLLRDAQAFGDALSAVEVFSIVNEVAEVPGTLSFANFLQALVTFARLRFPAQTSVNAAASALCDNHVFLVNASSARASEASVDSLALPEVIDVLRAHRPQLGRLYSAFSLTPQQRVACTNVEQLPDASGALSLGSFLIMLHQLAVVPALLARKAAVRAFMASCMFPPPAGIDEMSEARTMCFAEFCESAVRVAFVICSRSAFQSVYPDPASQVTALTQHLHLDDLPALNKTLVKHKMLARHKPKPLQEPRKGDRVAPGDHSGDEHAARILWQVFVHYANLGSVGVSTVLTMNNLRRMLRDARVSDAKFTSYQVDAVLAQWKGVLDFGGLQAVLMELAKRKFPTVADPQDAYRQILRDHLLPYCSRLEGDNMQQTMREPAIVEVFARYEVPLRRIFAFYARQEDRADGSWEDIDEALHRLSYREFCLFAQHFELVPDIISWFTSAKIFRLVVLSGGVASAVELSFGEFLELLARCSLACYSQHPYDKQYPTLADKLRAMFEHFGLNDETDKRWLSRMKSVRRSWVAVATIKSTAGQPATLADAVTASVTSSVLASALAGNATPGAVSAVAATPVVQAPTSPTSSGEGMRRTMSRSMSAAGGTTTAPAGSDRVAALFQRYSVWHGGPGKINVSGVVRVMRDAGMLDTRISFGSVRKAFIDVARDAPVIEQAAFAEVLHKVAVAKYGAKYGPKAQNVMEEYHLGPLVEAPVVDAEADAIYTSDVLNMMDAQLLPLQRVFATFSRSGTWGEAFQGNAMMSDFVGFAATFDVTPTLLNKQTLLLTAAKCNVGFVFEESGQKRSSKPTRLFFPEFIEFLARCGLAVCSRYPFSTMYTTAPKKVEVMLEHMSVGDTQKLTRRLNSAQLVRTNTPTRLNAESESLANADWDTVLNKNKKDLARLFSKMCLAGEPGNTTQMSLHKFLKFARYVEVLNSALTAADIDVIFHRVTRSTVALNARGVAVERQPRQKRLTFDLFLSALCFMANQRFPDMHGAMALHELLVRFVLPRIPPEPPAASVDVHDPEVVALLELYRKPLQLIFASYCVADLTQTGSWDAIEESMRSLNYSELLTLFQDFSLIPSVCSKAELYDAYTESLPDAEAAKDNLPDANDIAVPGGRDGGAGVAAGASALLDDADDDEASGGANGEGDGIEDIGLKYEEFCEALVRVAVASVAYRSEHSATWQRVEALFGAMNLDQPDRLRYLLRRTGRVVSDLFPRKAGSTAFHAEGSQPNESMVAAGSGSVDDELRLIFEHYCSVGEPENINLMSAHKFAMLVRDTRLLQSTSIGMPDVQVVFWTVTRSAKSPESRLPFARFQEALLQLAVRVYPKAASPTESYQQLLQQHILPYAARRPDVAADSQLENTEVEQVWNEYRAPLLSIFAAYSRLQDGAEITLDQAEAEPGTLDITRLHKMMQDFGVVPRLCSRTRVAAFFRASAARLADRRFVAESNVTLTYDAFLNLLGRLAVVVMPHEKPWQSVQALCSHMELNDLGAVKNRLRKYFKQLGGRGGKIKLSGVRAVASRSGGAASAAGAGAASPAALAGGAGASSSAAAAATAAAAVAAAAGVTAVPGSPSAPTSAAAAAAAAAATALPGSLFEEHADVNAVLQELRKIFVYYASYGKSLSERTSGQLYMARRQLLRFARDARLFGNAFWYPQINLAVRSTERASGAGAGAGAAGDSPSAVAQSVADVTFTVEQFCEFLVYVARALFDNSPAEVAFERLLRVHVLPCLVRATTDTVADSLCDESVVSFVTSYTTPLHRIFQAACSGAFPTGHPRSWAEVCSFGGGLTSASCVDVLTAFGIVPTHIAATAVERMFVECGGSSASPLDFSQFVELLGRCAFVYASRPPQSMTEITARQKVEAFFSLMQLASESALVQALAKLDRSEPPPPLPTATQEEVEATVRRVFAFYCQYDNDSGAPVEVMSDVGFLALAREANVLDNRVTLADVDELLSTAADELSLPAVTVLLAKLAKLRYPNAADDDAAVAALVKQNLAGVAAQDAQPDRVLVSLLSNDVLDVIEDHNTTLSRVYLACCESVLPSVAALTWEEVIDANLSITFEQLASVAVTLDVCPRLLSRKQMLQIVRNVVPGRQPRLLYPQFIEVLGRFAIAICSEPPYSTTYTTVARKLEALLVHMQLDDDAALEAHLKEFLRRARMPSASDWTVIRPLFDHYTGVAGGKSKSSSIRLSQVLLMCRDCRILDNRVSPSQVMQLVAAVMGADSGPMSYETFARVVMSIACAKFPGREADAAVNMLLENHVVPWATRSTGGADLGAIYDEAVVRVLEVYEVPLQQLFAAYSRSEAVEGQMVPTSKRTWEQVCKFQQQMRFGEFVELCEAFGVLPTLCSRAALSRFFAESSQKPASSSAQVRLTFAEFCECMVRLGMHASGDAGVVGPGDGAKRVEQLFTTLGLHRRDRYVNTLQLRHR